jgi:chromosome partitioning protein
MIIAVMNNKGGVGKTTTTVHVGYALAQQGKRVLCVDMDAQANLVMHLFNLNILHDLEIAAEMQPEILLHEASGMAILPLSFWNVSAEQYIRFIQKTAQDYDVTLIDCPPALDVRSIAALDACDGVIIPTEPEDLSVNGLHRLLRVCDERNKPILAVIVTKLDRKKAAHNIYLPFVASSFPRYYIDAPVPNSAVFPAASAMRKTGYEWNGKKANAALTAYSQIASQIAKTALDKPTPKKK